MIENEDWSWVYLNRLFKITSGDDPFLHSITILISLFDDSSLKSTIPSTFFSWPGRGFSLTSSAILSIKADLLTAYGISLTIISLLPFSRSTISVLDLIWMLPLPFHMHL